MSEERKKTEELYTKFVQAEHDLDDKYCLLEDKEKYTKVLHDNDCIKKIHLEDYSEVAHNILD